MFSTFAVLASCTALLSLAAPLPIHNAVQQRDSQSATQPADWWTDGLEPYATYHARYMALDCIDEHGTAFFDACCHPLLKTETLEANREPQCNPANTCDDNDNDNGDDTPAPKASAAPAPKASEAPKPAAPAPAPPKNVAPAPPKNVAPAPAPKPAPAPAPKPAPAPAPKPAPAPAPPANSQLHTGGHGTWFTQNGVAGACGTVHKDSDHVVALDTATYQNGANCGKTISITDTATGKTFNGVVADECPTCDNSESVDMSTSLFQEFNPLSVGEFNIEWKYV